MVKYPIYDSENPQETPKKCPVCGGTFEDIPSLQTQLDDLKQLLHQAAWERAQIQSQLEWVLYRLEQFNVSSSTETPPLLSEVGIDYQPLAQLLQSGQWKAADQLTWTLFLKIALRELEGWFTLEDLENFPVIDLRTMTNLWDYYSQGLFGLEAQKQIWERVAANYTNFSDQVGWRTQESWKYYDELSFSLEAPLGHLPVIAWRQRACYGVGHQMAGETQALLIAKLTHQ